MIVKPGYTKDEEAQDAEFVILATLSDDELKKRGLERPNVEQLKANLAHMARRIARIEATINRINEMNKRFEEETK